MLTQYSCLLTAHTYSVLMLTQCSYSLSTHITSTLMLTQYSVLMLNSAHGQLCAHAHSVSCTYPGYGSTHDWWSSAGITEHTVIVNTKSNNGPHLC